MNADQIWNDLRYRLIFEYYEFDTIPPPLNFVSYFFNCIRFLRKINKTNDQDNEQDDLLFEKKFAEEFMRNKVIEYTDTISAHLAKNTKK